MSVILVESRKTTSWPTGAYVGSWDSADLTTRRVALSKLETFRGRSSAKILDWVAAAADGTWTKIEGASWAVNVGGAAERTRFVVTNVPLPVDSSTTLTAGAAGTYDAHWTAFANNLVSIGLAAAPVRLFHEMNGNWYRWSLGVNVNGGNPNYATTGTSEFITYWQRIHDAMRTAGHTGAFIFCPNNGISGSGFSAELAYPGDSYVDIIAPDAYDQSYLTNAYPYSVGESRSAREARQDVAWGGILNGSRGLAYWRDFAISHSKKFGLTEWGLMNRPDGHGGMDNPRFIRRIHQFLADAEAAHPGLLAYDMYFNYGDAVTGVDIDSYIGPGSEFPLATDVYRYRWSQ